MKAGNGKMVRQVTKGPISAAGGEEFPRELFVVSREEAPEEMIFRTRDAADRRLSGRLEAKRDANEDHPKKGRGTSIGFGFRARPGRFETESGAFSRRIGVEAARLLPWGKRIDGKRRLSW
ncbi:MAG TPA: hypothetical protein VMK31_05325 [Sphingomicrobium sp.]|nr:hypothetical protein [Sphingomicrobium sp.]